MSGEVLEGESTDYDGVDSRGLQLALAEVQADLQAALDRIDELEQQVAQQQQRIENMEQDASGDDLTTLERYAAMPPEDREELIGSSERRAVAIFSNWWDLAKETPSGWVVSTERNSKTKNQPSQFKVDLERITGESLQWMQIYRAMHKVAKLSGGEEIRDDYDRLHIQQGAFEYHEKPTPDGDKLIKRLVLAEPDSLTLL